jgi:ElaB/YqjD/DUF883 family membrane-anchored ribosome-binding protein
LRGLHSIQQGIEIVTIENDSFTNGKDPSRDVKNAVRDGADQVKSSIKSTARDAKRGASRMLEDASHAADEVGDALDPDFADTAGEKLRNLRDDAQDKAGDMYDGAVSYVRDRPVSSLALAVLGGAVLALLVRRVLV